MGDTKIEWTDKTWNPVVGCEKVSQGCARCYAKRDHDKRHVAFLAGKGVAPQYSEPFEVVQLKPERLDLPLRWRKSQFVFVNSVSDLFHKDVPFEFIAAVFGVMSACPQHTFQVLTKRPERMREFFRWLDRDSYGALSTNERSVYDWESRCLWHLRLSNLNAGDKAVGVQWEHLGWPLPNVWLGVSVEDQGAADLRIPLLLACPAAVHWISAEPLLGPVNLVPFLGSVRLPRGLDGVVVGGESGKGARPMHPAWVRDIRDRCLADGVDFFFKQWGEWAPLAELAASIGYSSLPAALLMNKTFCHKIHKSETFRFSEKGPIVYRVGKKMAGRIFDGRTWDDLPEVQITPGRDVPLLAAEATEATEATEGGV